MARKIRRKRRRRLKQQPRKNLKMQEKKSKNDNLCVKKQRACAALVVRLPGGAFREFLAQKVPGYTSLENTVFDEYVKTIGKWEAWLFFYLGVIYILRNFPPPLINPVYRPSYNLFGDNPTT